MRKKLLHALLGVSMVAALVTAPQTLASAAPNVGTWDGFAASALPNTVLGGGNDPANEPPQGWGVATTDDIGGSGSDLWINNHALASEWFADGSFASATPRDENPATPAALDAVDSHGIAFSDFNDDGLDDLVEIRARDNDNAITDGAAVGGPSSVVTGAEDMRGRGRAVLPVDVDWDGNMDIVVGNLDRTELNCDDGDTDGDPLTGNCFDGGPADAPAPSDLYLGNGDLTFTSTNDNGNNNAISDADVTLVSMTRTGPGAASVIVTHNNFTVGLDSLAVNVSVPTAATNGVGQVQGAGNNANNIRDVAFGDLDGNINTVEYAVARIDGEDPANALDNSRQIVTGSISQAGTPLTPVTGDLRTDSCATVAIGDFDNDRDLDIFGGCTYDAQFSDVFIENDGSGNFTVMPLAASPTNARAVASAISDFNGDGFLDVVVVKGWDTEAGADILYTNQGGSNNWLQIDLESSDNPDAMGAQVFVGSKAAAATASVQDWQVREVAHAYHRGQDWRTLHFGLGDAEEIAPVVVVWPEGSVEECTVAGANQRVTITQGSADCSPVADLAATLAAPPVFAVDTRPTCFGEPVTISFDAAVANAHNDAPFDITFATTGTNGDDVILGTAGDDTINGLGGDDLICAGDGDDTVDGGSGNDNIAGGDGDDLISGADGVDRLFGQDGRDELNGDAGRDKLAGGSGNDVLNGGSERDRIDGNKGADIVNGGTGRDLLFGGGGTDTINGDEGNDRIRGGDGDDVLNGNGGTDSLDGSNGDDELFGNGGNDTLIGGDGTDSGAGGSGTDVCSADIESRAGSCEA